MTPLCLVLATVGLSLLSVEAELWYPVNPQPVPVHPMIHVNPHPPPVPINPYTQPHPNPYRNPYPVPTGQSFSKCSPAVIQAVKTNFWNTYGIPRNLIKTYMGYGKEVVVKTTRDYYPDRPVCVYSHFFQQYFTLFKVSENGFRSSQSFNIIEVDGTLYNPDTEVLRVHMMIYRGVSLVYTCSLAYNAVVGSPQGFVKIRDGNSDLNFAYFGATQLMQSIGIHLTDEYPPIC